VDIRPLPEVPAGVTLGVLLAEVRTLRTCPGCSFGTASLLSSSTFGTEIAKH